MDRRGQPEMAAPPPERRRVGRRAHQVDRIGPPPQGRGMKTHDRTHSTTAGRCRGRVLGLQARAGPARSGAGLLRGRYRFPSGATRRAHANLSVRPGLHRPAGGPSRRRRGDRRHPADHACAIALARSPQASTSWSRSRWRRRVPTRERLIDAAAQRGVLLMVGHTFEHNSAVWRLRDLVQAVSWGTCTTSTVRGSISACTSRTSTSSGTSLRTTCRSPTCFWAGRRPSVQAWGSGHAHRRFEDVAYLRMSYDEIGVRRTSMSAGSTRARCAG